METPGNGVQAGALRSGPPASSSKAMGKRKAGEGEAAASTSGAGTTDGSQVSKKQKAPTTRDAKPRRRQSCATLRMSSHHLRTFMSEMWSSGWSGGRDGMGSGRNPSSLSGQGRSTMDMDAFDVFDAEPARDSDSFDIFDTARQPLAAASRGTRVRLWSASCSTLRTDGPRPPRPGEGTAPVGLQPQLQARAALAAPPCGAPCTALASGAYSSRPGAALRAAPSNRRRRAARRGRPRAPRGRQRGTGGGVVISCQARVKIL